jgi:hypothetical protein
MHSTNLSLVLLIAAMTTTASCALLSEASQTKYRITALLPSDKRCLLGDHATALVDVVQESVTPFGFTRLKDIVVSGHLWSTFSLGGGFPAEKRVNVIVIEQERRIGIVDFKATNEEGFVRRLRDEIEAKVQERCGAAGLNWVHTTSWDPS